MNRSIDEIRQINRRRRHLREEANRKVFKLCMDRIRQFAYRGVQFMPYEVPAGFGNNPYYDRNDCREYLIGRLSTNFAVRARGYTLLIDWSSLE